MEQENNFEPIEPTQEPRLWSDERWTACVIKNEDDDGWAVAMTLHGHDDAAAHSGGQHGNGQHSVDAGAGDELTKALGQRLQSDEKCQHNGGFGDPTYFFVHSRYLFPNYSLEITPE